MGDYPWLVTRLLEARFLPAVGSALDGVGLLQLDVAVLAPPWAPAVAENPVVAILSVSSVANQLDS